MLELLLLILGLVGLWIGSQLTIQGSIFLAKRFKISQLFFGLTILALGTDLPELIIDINAALQRLAGVETSGLIIGETLGTTISQMTMIIGFISFFGILTITRKELKRDGIAILISIILLFLLGIDGTLSRIDGVIMIMAYAFYFLQIAQQERVIEKVRKNHKSGLTWSFLSIVGGLALVILASEITIDNAIHLSSLLGVSQSFIGITIVGLGTSLPELATSLTAVRKGASKLALGNIFGSTIFDLLFTLGVGTVISTFIFDKSLLFIDLGILFVVSVAVILFFRKNLRLSKSNAIILIVIYLTYILINIFKQVT